MKKLIIKDKKLRFKLKSQDKQYFILKTIFQNSNLFHLVRWNAHKKLQALGKANSKVAVAPRCLYTVSRRRFKSLAPFSRHLLLKLIRNGQITGLRKSSW